MDMKDLEGVKAAEVRCDPCPCPGRRAGPRNSPSWGTPAPPPQEAHPSIGCCLSEPLLISKRLLFGQIPSTSTNSHPDSSRDAPFLSSFLGVACVLGIHWTGCHNFFLYSLNRTLKDKVGTALLTRVLPRLRALSLADTSVSL